jgi:hypothetical protein
MVATTVLVVAILRPKLKVERVLTILCPGPAPCQLDIFPQTCSLPVLCPPSSAHYLSMIGSASSLFIPLDFELVAIDIWPRV